MGDEQSVTERELDKVRADTAKILCTYLESFWDETLYKVAIQGCEHTVGECWHSASDCKNISRINQWPINPLKCSGIRRLHLKLFIAIKV